MSREPNGSLPEDVWQAFDTFASEGLRIHITEFTPTSSGKEITGCRHGTWTEDAQAEFAEQMLRLSFGHPNVVSFNFWGDSLGQGRLAARRRSRG